MLRITLAALALVATGWTLTGPASPVHADLGDAALLEDIAGRQVAMREGQTLSVFQAGLSWLRKASVAKGFRLTLCEGSTTKAVCRRYVGANADALTEFTLPEAPRMTVAFVEKALFGFADLHVHPATHLAWGARGGRGILWGTPGMAHTATSYKSHLAVCNDFHSTPTTAGQVVTRPLFLLSRGHGEHSGYPAFTDWPSAPSILHQQMHVRMLRRAYEGGLRLMVASATDNQMLDIIWNPDFSISQGRFALREDADHKAAKEQFDFIRRFVTANADWMMIARTPTEARQAIAANKLAVVLGLEMDELSAEEILELKATYGVGLVVPVHLVNNSFGGAAAYEPMFNVANYVMTGSLFRVERGSELGCRDPDPGDGDADPDLGTCQPFRFDGIPELPLITDLMGDVGDRLAEYAATPAGHRNRVGLLDEYGIRRLMKAGLLIDTAHMSARATNHAIDLSDRFGYPLVHSHGGMMWGEVPSERSMTEAQWEAHADSGGILGLGTGSSAEDPVTASRWLKRFLDAASFGPVALGSDLNGMAQQISRPGVALPYPTAEIQEADWRTENRVGPLSKFLLGTKRYDIAEDGIAHIGMLPDFLAAARRRAAVGNDVPQFDQVFHSAHDFIATWEKATNAAAVVDPLLPPLPLSRVLVTIETGTDNLKCGGVAVTASKLVNGRLSTISLPAMVASGQTPHSTHTMFLTMLPGTQLRDLYRIRFQYLTNKCDPFDTGDTWNIKTLKVTYSIATGNGGAQGVLMHKRGAPAKKLARGTSWNVYTER